MVSRALLKVIESQNEYIKSLEKQIEAKDSDISKLETIQKKHRQYITNLEEVKTPTQKEKKELKKKKPKDRKVDKRSSFISLIKDIFWARERKNMKYYEKYKNKCFYTRVNYS